MNWLCSTHEEGTKRREGTFRTYVPDVFLSLRVLEAGSAQLPGASEVWPLTAGGEGPLTAAAASANVPSGSNWPEGKRKPLCDSS